MNNRVERGEGGEGGGTKYNLCDIIVCRYSLPRNGYFSKISKIGLGGTRELMFL